MKPGKKDRQIFDGAYRISPDSPCVNDFTNKLDEGELLYGSAFTRHLIRIYNLRISYPNQELLLFDDDASGAYKHVKYHPDVAGACSFMIKNMLYVPLGCQFGQTVSGYRWEIIPKCRMLLAEYYQSQPCINDLVSKDAHIIDKIKFPPDVSSARVK